MRVSFQDEQVMLGVEHGDLLGATFMRPSPHVTLLIEFPSDESRFFDNEEVVLRSREINYIVWL